MGRRKTCGLRGGEVSKHGTLCKRDNSGILAAIKFAVTEKSHKNEPCRKDRVGPSRNGDEGIVSEIHESRRS
jgi:hypothetical protein